MKTIGFVGCGNMGEALLKGISSAGLHCSFSFIEPSDEKAQKISTTYGATRIEELQSLTTVSDIIIFCVKPALLPALLREAEEELDSERILVSIAAGVSLATMEEASSKTTKLVRVMPNTPALIGKGVSVITDNGTLSKEEQADITRLFKSVGEVLHLPESSFDAVTALSGSGPAYLYQFVLALTQGGVSEGLSVTDALTLATETVIGAAEMIKRTKEHPSVLTDRVTSPGGTTIAALTALNKHGFSSAVIEGVKAASKRSKELGN